MWDCGNYWDGYDSPTHVGLTDELRDEYIDKLKEWRDSCVALSRQQTHCLKKANATSARNAVMLAKRSEYMQEVCGEYVDEDKRWFLENKELATFIAVVFGPMTLGAATFAIGVGGSVALSESGKGITDGFNETGLSIFADDTAKHVTDREYR